MNTPIINGLKKYIEENNVRFHMPGHKGKELMRYISDMIPQIDVTEVEGTDNLHNPSSIIQESMNLAAKTFGAKKTFYSVNGTTGGIYAAITSTISPNGKILIQRNCHRSVYNALILGRIKHKYIYPEYSHKDQIITSVKPEDIEVQLKEDDEIEAVVITYPSYYGICCDIEKVSQIVHKYNKILIVDEAHGSHLKFNDKLPKSSLEAGADIVIQSTHKTLPAFTQSSMIHVGSDRVDIEKLRIMTSFFQTTSPSYLLMASIDYARAYMEGKGKIRLDILIYSIEKWCAYMKSIKGVKIFDKDKISGASFYDFDMTKILISIKGISGFYLERILREEYSIQLEMSDSYYGVALTSLMDDEENLQKLANAVEEITKKYCNDNELLNNIDIRYIYPEIKMSLYDAFYSNKIDIALNDSVGKISADFIIPYPPGIPVVCPGEQITEEIVKYINSLKKNNIQILGFLDYNKEKIKVVE
ncbi:aminotransferase class I/II-fold pyridoxal phosphate-dependent enzyme [Brassicibacter mesophilus]|uniref:aminotransferase class I/II-fold pyridoxal phosphate-dependent enzyme n=1 Tax=Brassicibacter mesophilus TaxID=745119 RepID=UPI003D1C828E